jgi:hypothetical protein
VIFDIEGDDLNATLIHVLSYMDGDKVVSLTDYDGMREWLLAQPILIGHNIILWDVPTLERILDIKIKAKLIDTLALSWYLYDDRNVHGLEEWGEEFGIPKPVIKDWKTLPLETYIHRCEEDVKINDRLWRNQQKYLGLLYGVEPSNVTNLTIVWYLSFKLDCIQEQARSRWKVDKETILSNLDFLTTKKEEKEVVLRDVMPKVPVYASYKRPVRPFKKDGSLSSHGENWKARTESLGLTFDHMDDIKVAIGYEEPNPSSPDQQKKWLFSLGWKPLTFKYVKEDDGTSRAIPQIKKQFEPEFCDSVKELYEVEPKLKDLEGLSIINSRISNLNGLLEKEEDGWVKAEIGGLTNTLRFKHKKPCVNLPKVAADVLYGELVRECFVADDGYELCGSDMTALEDLTKRHYIYMYDPEYVEEMSKPGFDPHLDLAARSGKISLEDTNFYKWASKDGAQLNENTRANLKFIKKIRQDYKKTNYSATYGIGAEKLARDLKSTKQVAKQLLNDFWKRNEAVRKVADACEVKTVKGTRWLYNPVSKFWYTLRKEHDRFSTLNQSTGVYVFDKWIANFRKRRPQLTANFHDEVVLHLKKGNRDKMNKLLQEAIDKVNDEVKLNIKLSIDIKYGDNYGTIH